MHSIREPASFAIILPLSLYKEIIMNRLLIFSLLIPSFVVFIFIVWPIGKLRQLLFDPMQLRRNGLALTYRASRQSTRT